MFEIARVNCIENIVEKRRTCSIDIASLFHNIVLDFHVEKGTRFSLRDKWLCEVSEVEITRIDCTYIYLTFSKRDNKMGNIVFFYSGRRTDISKETILMKSFLKAP